MKDDDWTERGERRDIRPLITYACFRKDRKCNATHIMLEFRQSSSDIEHISLKSRFLYVLVSLWFPLLVSSFVQFEYFLK